MFAQGIVVFQNIGSGKPVRYDVNMNGVNDETLDKNLVAADGVQLSLWFAPAGTTDPKATSWEMLGVPTAVVGSGLFAGGNRTVPGATDASLRFSFQVRAWETAVYGNTASGWAQASTANGAKISLSSPVIDSNTGGFGTVPPVNMAPLFGAQPNILVGVVPEPSVFALGVLGVGALLMLRRRK
jgi:MYXO-CTERM domain-containing protein